MRFRIELISCLLNGLTLGAHGRKFANLRAVVESAVRPVTFSWNSYPLSPLRLLRRFATRNDKKICGALIGAPHIFYVQ